jgi:predicted Rossmann fold flavoprotein
VDYDVAIIGAGAAGLMCAIEAGRCGRSVLVIEHADRPGKKILISGGGRCNFTNLYCSPANFVSANPHFCKSALARYTPADFLEMVERHGIAYHEKEAGQLFCDDSSKLILQMLLEECASVGAQVDAGRSVDCIERLEGRFELATNRGSISAESLVVATGGLSIPPMGATGKGYEIARQFGHTVVPTRAALVPLTLSGSHLEHYKDLSGVALPVESLYKNQRFAAGMLFTHRGLSGPAILQVSLYWQPGDELSLNLAPKVDAFAWLTEQQQKRPAAELRTVLGELLPKRLAQRLCELSFNSQVMRHYREADVREIARQLHSWPIVAGGTEGYRTAEVTAGGVDTNELSSTTMESRRVPGLFFIGEVVDVTGQLGGFNFQWAWASAHAAGQAA